MRCPKCSAIVVIGGQFVPVICKACGAIFGAEEAIPEHDDTDGDFSLGELPPDIAVILGTNPGRFVPSAEPPVPPATPSPAAKPPEPTSGQPVAKPAAPRSGTPVAKAVVSARASPVAKPAAPARPPAKTSRKAVTPEEDDIYIGRDTALTRIPKSKGPTGPARPEAAPRAEEVPPAETFSFNAIPSANRTLHENTDEQTVPSSDMVVGKPVVEKPSEEPTLDDDLEPLQKAAAPTSAATSPAASKPSAPVPPSGATSSPPGAPLRAGSGAVGRVTEEPDFDISAAIRIAVAEADGPTSDIVPDVAERPTAPSGTATPSGLDFAESDSRIKRRGVMFSRPPEPEPRGTLFRVGVGVALVAGVAAAALFLPPLVRRPVPALSTPAPIAPAATPEASNPRAATSPAAARTAALASAATAAPAHTQPVAVESRTVPVPTVAAATARPVVTAPAATPRPTATPASAVPAATPRPAPTSAPAAVMAAVPRPSPTPAARSRLKPSAQDLEFLTGKAETLLQQGKLADAREQFDYILEQEPAWANAHFGIARVYEAQGDARSACLEYRTYLSLSPAGKYTQAAGKKAAQCK